MNYHQFHQTRGNPPGGGGPDSDAEMYFWILIYLSPVLVPIICGTIYEVLT